MTKQTAITNVGKLTDAESVAAARRAGRQIAVSYRDGITPVVAIEVAWLDLSIKVGDIISHRYLAHHALPVIGGRMVTADFIVVSVGKSSHVSRQDAEAEFGDDENYGYSVPVSIRRLT